LKLGLYPSAISAIEIGRSRRFGQAHRTSAERLAELRPNVVC